MDLEVTKPELRRSSRVELMVLLVGNQELNSDGVTRVDQKDSS